MNSEIISIETSLTPKELIEKLRSITITDLARLHNSPHAAYYGEITSYTFDIKNVRYGPMSPMPAMQGEIREGVNNTIVNIKMDIQSHHKITRNMYYSTLLPMGIIVMLLSALVLGGTEYQLQGFLFSSSFIACAFLVVALSKASLINRKKKELMDFSAIIGGKIISASNK